MIDGVQIHPLKQIPDERGMIKHMLRRDDPHFQQFGEIYFSVVYPNIVKGWHLHERMTLNYAVVRGMVKLALYDDRRHSPTFAMISEYFIGDSNYCLITIPPQVWNGFKAIGSEIAIVANCATEPHDSNEIVRLDPFDNYIPYKWHIVHK